MKRKTKEQKKKQAKKLNYCKVRILIFVQKLEFQNQTFRVSYFLNVSVSSEYFRYQKKTLDGNH